MLKRYKPFFRAGAMDLLAYKASIFMWFIISILEILCVVFLWFAVYKNSSNGMDSVINGFTFKEMLSYLVMINIFNFVAFDGNTLFTINDEIKNGTIAMSFTKPISYRMRFIADNLGAVSVQFMTFGIPTFTAAYIIFGLIGFINFTSVWAFLLYLLFFFIATLLATLINDTINYIFGVLCFYTSSGWGLNQIKTVIVSFLSGTLIPLSFFPGAFKNIVNILPFAGMAQNPVLIMLMKVDYIECLKIIGLSLFWYIVLEIFASLLFNHASKKVTVQGG